MEMPALAETTELPHARTFRAAVRSVARIIGFENRHNKKYLPR
jgi:hypothetical protein